MAMKIVGIKDQLNVSLRDPSKPWTYVLDLLEIKTGINRLYIFVSTIAFTAIWLVFGVAGQLVCNIIGFSYPAYASIHAIESPTKDDDTKWLTYWVVFALFSIIEFFADIIVGWFPFYWLIKCMFFVWLMIPTELNGALVMYRHFIRPVFLKHHGQIDAFNSNIKEAGSKILGKIQ